jgi:fibronectin type 3 domain-containing protein
VRAYNSSGVSGFSNVVDSVVPQSPPAAPTGLTAQVMSATQIDLRWTDNSSNETGFRVRRSTAGTFAVIATLPAGATSYSSTGLAADTTYSYQVAAYNGAGESAFDTATAKTSAAPAAPPPAPSQLKATAVSATAVRLEWKDNAQGQAGFVIERHSGSAYAVVTTLVPGVITWTNTGLSGGTSYTYRAKARNNSGDSAYSNTASATTRRK